MEERSPARTAVLSTLRTLLERLLTKSGMAALLVLVSLYDLLSPPINALIFRQTQTAMLTENFVRSGFRMSGLTVNIMGNVPALLVVEFPLYNAIVGALFALFGSPVFVGKVVSLASAVVTLLVLWRIAEELWGRRTAALAALFFVFTPEAMLVRTAFTPDAITLMFTLIGVFYMLQWRKRHGLRTLLFWNISFLAAGVMKFPTLVPFIPFCIYAALTTADADNVSFRWRVPRIGEVATFLIVFLAPFIGWFVYRADMIYEPWRGFAGWQNFLIGDLRRFTWPSYYPHPMFAFAAYAVCGAGLVLLASALRGRGRMEVLMFAGIPLFYVMIPTVQYQHHYLYALAPWIAILMARGWEALPRTNRGKFARTAVATVYAAAFLVGSAYVLRHDRVVIDAAAALEANSAPGNLTVGLLLHDRNYLGSEMHPELFYLSQRRGWNVGFAVDIPPTSIDSVVEGFRAAGATRLVLTTYDSTLEPWFARWIPASLRRNPNYDVGTVAADLHKHYRVIAGGRNYLVFSL